MFIISSADVLPADGASAVAHAHGGGGVTKIHHHPKHPSGQGPGIMPMGVCIQWKCIRWTLAPFGWPSSSTAETRSGDRPLTPKKHQTGQARASGSSEVRSTEYPGPSSKPIGGVSISGSSSAGRQGKKRKSKREEGKKRKGDKHVLSIGPPKLKRD